MKEKNILRKNQSRNSLSWLAMAALALPMIGNSQIAQTVNSANNSSEWNDAVWGGLPAAAPTAANNYVTATGFFAANNTFLGVNVTGRMRAYAATGSGGLGGGTFLGNSLTVIAGTELLVKEAGTYNANLTLSGGVLRFAPDTSVNATWGGSINVASDSILGVVRSGGGSAFTIASTLTGSSTLRLASGQTAGVNNVITFDDGVGTSLNGYSGLFDIGGGTIRVTVDFNQPYNLSLANLRMGAYSTLDVLNLDANITVGSFNFGATPLAGGIYNASALNGTFGNGSQFTGAGTLTVVPEPSSMALVSSLGMALFLARGKNRIVKG